MGQWAIAIGINQYHSFQPLSYAQQDAEALQQFLVQEAGFPAQNCLLLTDTSPPIFGKSTYPTQDAIQTWLGSLSQQPFQAGDVVWFFFSGYGVCHEGQDYLVPIDGDPSLVTSSAIPFQLIFDRLREIAATPVLVFLDMNRSQGMVSNEVAGHQAAQLAQDFGIPTVFSCQPSQFSREVAGLGHGVFTTALLEKLRSPQPPTLEDLSQYLGERVPQLGEHHQRPLQDPIVIATPEQRQQSVLPRSSTLVGSGLDRSPLAGAINLAESPFQLPTAELWEAPRNGSASGVPVVPSGAAASSAQPTLIPMNPRSNPSNDRPSSASEIPDTQFWRPLLLWGGMAVALLLVGVLWKNWSAITQGGPAPIARNWQKSNPSANQLSGPKIAPAPGAAAPGTPAAAPSAVNPAKPIESPVPPVAPVKPIESAPPGAAAPQPPVLVKPAAPSSAGQLALEKAKAKTKSDQVTAYAAAIQEASKIQPSQPEYAEARRSIDEWSQEILELARQQAKRQQLDMAVLLAAYIPDRGTTDVYRDTQTELGRWCKGLSPNPLKETAQQQAKDFCRKRGF
jgi:hypothetical protein